MPSLISELDDHGFDSTSTARKVARINAAYYDICSREPWPFLEKTILLTFAGGSATAANFPTDFRAATALMVTSNSGSQIQYVRRDDWVKAYGASNTATTAGTPTMYYFVAGVMNFYPVPTSGVTIQLDYLKLPAALTATSLETDIVISPMFHDVIRDGALFKLYAMEDDTDIAPTFETYFERGIANMREESWRLQYDQQEIIHPVDADDLGLDYGWSFGNNWPTS